VRQHHVTVIFPKRAITKSRIIPARPTEYFPESGLDKPADFVTI